jgi:colicin import membrane protein
MMMESKGYRTAFFFAIGLHILVGVMLFSETSSQRPVLELAAQSQETRTQPMQSMPEVDPIRAVSVDSKEVQETVNRLKMERLKQKQAEDNHQKALVQQAEAAQRRRVEEQQRLEKLKDESAKLAIAREKQLVEEQRRLKQLAQQKVEEEKRLADMKKKQLQLQKEQQEEASKLAELKKKKTEELAQANKEKLEKAKEDAERKRQAAAEQAAREAEKNAQMAGEVDKYKALIINAISRQWILPENVDSTLSSQFRIRLAPDGAVLEVSLSRSSGDPILDRSAQSAIYKASPLPVPTDPATFDVFRDISLTVRPENVRG